MSKASQISRGDKSRNARLGRLRELVPTTSAIVGIDLADAKQMVVVCDHDSRVLARKTFRVRAWDLGSALDWAAEKAAKVGFAGVTVACEPTGHRWRILGQLAAERGMAFVLRPAADLGLGSARGRPHQRQDRREGRRHHRASDRAAALLCPEPVDETWGRLRHLGARRERLVVELTAQIQQVRDLLECVWPAALTAANYPFRSTTWAATMTVILDRDGGDFARTKRLGLKRLENQVRKEVIVGAVRNRRCGSPGTCSSHWRTGPGSSPTAAGRWSGWSSSWPTGGDPPATPRGRAAHGRGPRRVGADGTDHLHPGLGAVGAATILAETGDPHRFTSARALVKHAGLAPRERSSGTFVGRTRVTGQGRPGLRLAAWRGIWGTLRANPGSRCPLHVSDDAGAQPAEADAGAGCGRGGVAAAVVRRHRRRPPLGSRRRHLRLASASGGGRRLRT